MTETERVEEMMGRVRKLELRARRLVKETFSGEFLSTFRGQGLDFDDFREYAHGDEVRFIDWNVTARMNTPYVRKFREERELSVMLAVDISGSADFGSDYLSKREFSAEIAAVLGFSAVQNGDQVGLCIFAEEVVSYIPPAKGSRHLLRMIRELLVAKAGEPGTSFENVCNTLVRNLKRKALVFLISDFHADQLDKPIGKLARKHETVALRVHDPVESVLPKVGRVVLVDPETGFETEVNTGNENVRMGYRKLMRRQAEGVAALCKKHGIEFSSLRTDEDMMPRLYELLKRRGRAKR